MKLFSTIVLICLILSSCQESNSTETAVTNRKDVIVDSIAVKRIDSTLKAYINKDQIAGVSALVYEQGEEVYFKAFGFADRERNMPMDRSTIAMIYSMTKPITGTALMQLYEQGLFKLDDSLSMYLPEFLNMKVYMGVDANGTMKTEATNRPISIRDITRHTAGFANNTEIPGLGAALTSLNLRDYDLTLTQYSEKLASIPLQFQPGRQWEYGPSVDIQARLVEKLSGQSFQNYIEEHILNPLKMDHTAYFVETSERTHLAASYNLSGDSLQRVDDSIAWKLNTKRWNMTPGGYGLTSTVDDYMRFAQMLLNKGSLDTVQILKPETVDLMATNHLADSIEKRSWLPSKGQVGFGIDFAVRLREPQSKEENNGAVGEFFWDGAASTLFWVDPKNQLTAVLFVQLFPYDQISLHKNFRDAIYGPIELNAKN